MDNNINNIDEFFKDRLEGQESPYVPGAWEQMEAMLDADQSGLASKNINRFILASIAGAIILAGSVVAYVSGGEQTVQLAEKVSTPNEVIVENENNTAIANKNEAAIIEAPNTTNEDIKVSGDNDNTINNTPVAAPTAPKASVAPSATTTTPTPEKTTPESALTTGTADKAIVIADEEKTEQAIALSATALFDKNTYSTALLSAIAPSIDTRYNSLPDVSDFVTQQQLLIDSARRAKRKIDEMERFYRPQFGIQAGANFNRVLSNTSDNFELGSGLMAGFFFGKNITKKWGISAEVNYLRTTGNNISRTITQTDFFLEKTTTNFFIVTKSFDYLQVPFSVSYSPTSRHKFNFGASGLFMLNASSEVVTNKEKTTEKSMVSTTESGVYEDLNTMNYGLLLGYEYNLPGKYSLGLRYNQMFNDVTANSFFNDNKNHLPAHLQLYVKLNLTR